MRKKEYKQFYKIETELDDKGKVKSRPVYTGDYFVILNAPKEVKSIGIIALVILSFFTVAGAGLLFLDILSNYEVYIVLPNVIALAGAGSAIYYVSYLFLIKEKYNVFQKMKVETRLNQCLALSSSLCALSTVIRTVFLIAVRPKIGLTGEIITLLFIFLMSFATLFVLKLTNKIRFESINIPKE